MRHIFEEFVRYYEPITIQLVFADHLINIDTRAKGSSVLTQAFKDFKFDLYKVNVECKHLILCY